MLELALELLVLDNHLVFLEILGIRSADKRLAGVCWHLGSVFGEKQRVFGMLLSC